MKTIYCVGCLLVLRRWFVEMDRCEDLLGSVCAGCKRQLKGALDRLRLGAHRDGRVNAAVNKARRILFEQGVRT